VFISKVIYEGERGLKLTSTPSLLSFIRPPPIPLPPPFVLATHFALNCTLQPGSGPLPSLEGYGLKFRCLNSLGNADPASSAPPLAEGCGRLKFTRQRIWRGGNTRGDPVSWRPMWYVTKMIHDFGRGSFSSFLSLLPTSN